MHATSIRAREKWNDAGITLELGKTYRLTARGRWTDFFITTGPAGFDRWHLRPFERKRRVPEEAWFRLIGCLDRDPKTYFAIGTQTTYTPRSGGRLLCFANDVPTAYWNNWGSVTLEVFEVAD